MVCLYTSRSMDFYYFKYSVTCISNLLYYKSYPFYNSHAGLGTGKCIYTLKFMVRGKTCLEMVSFFGTPKTECSWVSSTFISSLHNI